MHGGHRLRLKERFLKDGLSSFQDHEVLELLLFYAIPQCDVNPLAHMLIEKFHTLRGVFEASLEELTKIDGMGAHAATLIRLVPQLSQFYMSLSTRDTKELTTSFDAGRFVCSKIGSKPTEQFCVICLDARRRLLGFETVESGTVSEANVHPRKVVECAIKNRASAVILAHNHPSGIMQASESDRLLTKKLCVVFEGLGIHVLDHIITAGSDKFLSMCDNGIMPN